MCCNIYFFFFAITTGTRWHQFISLVNSSKRIHLINNGGGYLLGFVSYIIDLVTVLGSTRRLCATIAAPQQGGNERKCVICE